MKFGKALAPLVVAVSGPVAGFADSQVIQTADSEVSGALEVSASFSVVSRGNTSAATTAGDGDLYIGDRAMLRLTYSGAKVFGDQADVTCLMLDHQPSGVTLERDCSPARVPFGAVGASGEYSIGFTVFPTDAPGLWITEVQFTDARTADSVTVEIKFRVHTELES
jgi:hypothetical protein